MNWKKTALTTANLPTAMPQKTPNQMRQNLPNPQANTQSPTFEKVVSSTNLMDLGQKKPFLLRGGIFIKKAIFPLKNKLNRQAWFIKLTNKEHWDGRIFTFPTMIYALYLAVKARSAFFFSAANPAIPTGGAIGENKADISRWIPAQYRPKNVVLEPTALMSDIAKTLKNNGLEFPLILKPTIGARGLMVRKVHNLTDIAEHICHYPTPFLVEEFIDYPIEAAVLYWKNPETNQSGILSVTVKAFLTVIGDGQTTVRDLLMQQTRGVLQVPRFEREKPELMAQMPILGEKIIVEPIGNHCRGTQFLNYNHLISPEMVAGFDRIQANLPDCYVFRLDLKTPSVNDLQNGRSIKILEINGVGSDPAHIFDPNTSIWEMWRAYLRLWRKIYEVGTAVHHRGVAYITWAEYKRFAAQHAAMLALQSE